jgi:MFS superfamily sulfate permease-like transporter
VSCSMKPERTATPRLFICSFRGPLCYANSTSFMCDVLSLVRLFSEQKGAPAAPRWLVVNFEMITAIDYCSSRMLEELHDRMEKRGVTLVCANLAKEAADFRFDLGFLSAFGPDKVFGSVDAAISAFEALNECVRLSMSYQG